MGESFLPFFLQFRELTSFRVPYSSRWVLRRSVLSEQLEQREETRRRRTLGGKRRMERSKSSHRDLREVLWYVAFCPSLLTTAADDAL
jgi:hypothetical protein